MKYYMTCSYRHASVVSLQLTNSLVRIRLNQRIDTCVSSGSTHKCPKSTSGWTRGGERASSSGPETKITGTRHPRFVLVPPGWTTHVPGAVPSLKYLDARPITVRQADTNTSLRFPVNSHCFILH